MIDREHEQLLHDVLGGSASPADAARLEAWLASSPEGRQRRLELEALFAALAAVPRVSPPAGLRDDVLAAIRAGARPATTPARRVPRAAWLLVPAAAAAIALAVAIPGWRQASRTDSLPDVSGSMAVRAPAARTRASLSLAGTRVTMTAAAGESGTIVSFDAAADAPVVIELDAGAATLLGISVNGLPPEAIRPDAAHGRIELALDGPARFSLNFRPALRRDELVKVVVRAGEHRAEGVLPQPGEER